MKNNYKKALTFIFILLVCSFITGISYSIYEQNIVNQKNLSFVDTNEKLSINYLDGKSFKITDLAASEVDIKHLSITNVSQNQVFVTLSLMDIEKSSDNVAVTLLDSDNKPLYSDTLSNMDCELLKTKELDAGKTLSFSIAIKNNNADVLHSFYANILAYTEPNKVVVENFKSTLLKNNQVKNTPLTEPGKDVAITDEGLILSKDDDGEAYYFRGNVVNNYLNFGGFTFRILRINGDGSIRVIMQDALDDPAPYNSNSEVVEDYTSKLIFQNTTIKNTLDSWLTTNLSDYLKYISKTSLCNEASTISEDDYLNTHNRLFVDNSPSLICLGQIEKENIGLINADEVTFAGAFQDKANTNYFLYNKNLKLAWWTMSGSQAISANNSVSGISITNNGSLSSDKKISMSLAIRPVISLDKNVSVNGDGSEGNPYTIKTN